MELQQYDKSSEACDNGLYWNASSPEIFFNKGQIMVCFGKYEEAIEFYEKALQFQKIGRASCRERVFGLV